MRLPLWIFISVIVQIFGDDSLETALNAVTNRQRSYQDGYADETNDDSLFFLPRNNGDESDAEDAIRNLNLESSLMDYLHEPDDNDREEIHQKSSPFRERLKQDTVQQYNRKYKLDDDDLKEQYYDRLEDSYYPNENSKTSQNLYNMRKRSYYPSIRWESVGMKKRSRAFQPDGPRESLYLLNYAPRDEIFNRLQEDEDSSDDIDYQWPAFNQKKWNSPRTSKRFPVSKRSNTILKSGDYQSATRKTQHKRSSPTETIGKTDPKVEQDLAEIFNPKQTTKSIKLKTVTDKSNETKVINLKTKSLTVEKVRNKTRELIPTVKPQSKPVPISNNKKSIDWSDYFGLDRRKKSEQSLDSDWLMDRYNKAVTKRKQTEDIVKNGDVNRSQFYDDKKLIEMDNKLRNIEESLIDDTLKYTGAHEDTSDRKETRYVKNRIISRLAAAYSLEKMRRALGEYRRAFAAEKLLTHTENQTPHEHIKRMSVGRKAAINPNDNHGKGDFEDNKIKCRNSDCSDSDVKIFDSELYPSYTSTCPQIETICNDISSGFGQHRNSIRVVCEMHQLCILCSDNNWFGPLRRCDVLYLSKINEICGEDSNCREAADNILNHKLNFDQMSVCSLACPERK